MKKLEKEIPPPVVRVENGHIKITTLEGQYGFRVCMYRNDDPVTRIFEFVPACPTGSCSTTEISKMEWDEERIDGQEYKIVVFAFDESGKLFSKPTTVTWTAPGPKISLPPPPNGEPVLVPNPHAETAPKPPTSPANDKSAEDGGSKPADQEAVNRLQAIIVDQLNALGQLEQSGTLPEWMNAARLNNMGAAAEEVFKQFPGNEKVKLMAGRILTNGKLIREALAKASKAAPAKRKPEPKPATTPADSPARGQEDEGHHTPIVSRVEKLGMRDDQTDKDLHAVGSLAAKGINELTQAIAGLRPATPPASGGTPPPQQQPIIQHFHYPNSKDNAGTGGDGDDSSGGGKASAEKNPPKSTDRSWIMLLLGILATLLLLLGFGGWIISSLLGGWILGSSKAPTAGFMPAMVPPVIMITNNTVTPVTPPAVQQAVVATTPPAQPAFTPGELADFARQHLATQSEHKQAIEAMFGHIQSGSKTPDKEALKVNGNGNVIGDGNTIINNYHQAPDVHRNGDQTVTPRQTDGATSTNSTAVRANSDWTGPRAVRTLPNWSPTGTFGKVEFLDLYGPGTGFASE